MTPTPSPLDAARSLQKKLSGLPAPKTALLLGSGLNPIAETITGAVTVPYTDIPGFPQCSTPGHLGMLSVGFLDTQAPVLCLSGRPHAYEGATPADFRHFIRTCRELGCERILITNAAGSLRPSVPPGELVMTTDHINAMGFNPLVGEQNTAYGPRFLDMSNLYSPALRATAQRVATSKDLVLHEGVFAGMLGPCFETPAEIKMLKTLGADTVAMSLVPESIVAHHCGMQVLALSVITNFAAGLTNETLSHEDTLNQAAKASSKLRVLLTSLAPALEQHAG